jgi:hypothetical protein
MNTNNSNPMRPMQTGFQNQHVVTLNGVTKVVNGANSGLDAARKVFGANGDKATVRTTVAQKWM